jgi:Cytochrome c554 and c-prime
MTILSRSLILGIGLALLAASAAAASPSYVGAKKCRACHIKQFQSWEKTRMAHAFELLSPGAAAAAKKKANLDPQKDYTHDPKCVGCHTTGFGSPGGFVSVEQTPELIGVQCESCHGAGGEYTKPGGMTLQNKEYHRADLVKLGLVVVSAETCTSSCHNNRSPFVGKDYVFDYAKRRTEGTHEHIALKYAH